MRGTMMERNEASKDVIDALLLLDVLVSSLRSNV